MSSPGSPGPAPTRYTVICRACSIELGARRASSSSRHGTRPRRSGSSPDARCRAARCGRRARRAAPWSTSSSPSCTASAPHGRSQPPPSPARNARSALTSRVTRRVVDRRDARRASSCVVGPALDRQRALPDLREHHRRRRAARRRGRAARGVRARRPRPRSRRSRRPSRGGSRCCRAARRTRGRARTAASWARRRTEPVATGRARLGSAASVHPTSASRTVGALGERGEHEALGGGCDGRSLAECTARSARPSSTRLLTSFTNTPVPPSVVDRRVGARVARGGDDDELGVAAEQRRDPLGLPAGERAAPRRDAQRRHRAARSVGVGSGSGSSNSSASASA